MTDSFTPQLLDGLDNVTVDTHTTFADVTSLRLGGRPRAFVRCSTPEAVVEVVRRLDDTATSWLIVGGGSNLVVADGELDLVAVAVENKEVSLGDDGLVRAGAGAVWDDVVAAAVERGFGGIECLSGIPGSAGATPVQNVGAYGTEISDVLTRVRLYERATGETRWVPASELELAYRYSNLKFTGRAVVLEIELQLTTDGLSAPLRFGQLAGKTGERRDVRAVREEVLGLRRKKGMVLDPAEHDTWSAGSFFTNPIVSAEVADRVRDSVRADRGDDDADRMPAWEVAGGIKLSAAWLIERAGFPRGYPGKRSPVRLSTKHTLALTNRGSATSEELANLARTIRNGVVSVFGVELVPEPVWIGMEF
ncbi:UDP-N-acetylmuramate dehydrogenase [Corynebacterium yudongzhengii]|uniref:UDP-N-acetylenolpyruvoylglucosamine reductase n=1 Tax=Corynebacterium yudongzhengii TaxID=2080740 RepID=A0A2U1T9K2_9CORY|nr:UDP-N-acetylmuramate dehydrogenase [Corynebacterium yudongzhengii]AWB81142.1 UDP-N-acetylmuramate dehydrogenase [Corynebacterium yudongzhengii]PWC02681.1 UDP-N-acetylmuramate dehydrogenase [Corynebacterium yudongzhengii]